MAQIRVRAMRADEFDAWRASIVPMYADDVMRNESLSPEDALRQAERETDELLASGLDTPGHRVFVAEDVVTGERIGYLWYGPRLRDPDAAVAWLYDIVVDEPMRGRGSGRELMRLLEDEARADGKSRIELNVFGDNERARHMYESLGYVEMARQMSKDLT